MVGSFESLADRKRRPLLGVVERRVGSRTGLSVFFVGGQFGCLRELGAPVLADVLLDEAAGAVADGGGREGVLLAEAGSLGECAGFGRDSRAHHGAVEVVGVSFASIWRRDTGEAAGI